MAATCQASLQIADPPGGYAQTCNACQHDCTLLLCSCRSADGPATQSGINYAACPGHSVTNVDGGLTCGKWTGRLTDMTRDLTGFMPSHIISTLTIYAVCSSRERIWRIADLSGAIGIFRRLWP